MKRKTGRLGVSWERAQTPARRRRRRKKKKGGAFAENISPYQENEGRREEEE